MSHSSRVPNINVARERGCPLGYAIVISRMYLIGGRVSNIIT